MFGIGLPELILIMALALIVVGPDKLPDMAKSIAKQLLELKKTANTLKDSLQEELKEEERPWEQLDKLREDGIAALKAHNAEKAKEQDGDGPVIDADGGSAEDVYAEAVKAASEGAAETDEEVEKKS